MNRIKRIVSALIATVMLSATTALAATWVNVSSWAYNDVSQFTNEGLLPESFDNVSDYRENITREQFAELVCSTLVKANVMEENAEVRALFQDTDSIAVEKLFSMGILSGTKEEMEKVRHTDNETGYTWEQEYKKIWFSPSEKITRQDASVIIYNALNWFSGKSYEDIEFDEDTVAWLNKFSDDNGIADYAKSAVYVLSRINIISGTDENKFLPKDNMTIEQAIIVCHGLYRRIPSAPAADGHGIAAKEETEIQRYSNGFVETKKGDVLYIKNGNDVLKEFETDIYSRIFSGGNYIAAQNINHRTEIYNALTGEFMFEIALTTYAVDDKYIYTQSKRFGLMKFGLYDYSGKELLPTDYSLEEIEILKNNDFKQPKAVKTEAEGWIYYSNWDDGGHLYKIDSNGENRQKLSDYDCYDISYYDGWLYYSIQEDENLYCVRNDGKYEQQFHDDNIEYMDFVHHSSTVTSLNSIEHTAHYYNSEYAYSENGVYFNGLDRATDNWHLYLVEHDETGNITKTEIASEYDLKDIYAFASDNNGESVIAFIDKQGKGYVLNDGKAVNATGDYNIEDIYKLDEEKDTLVFTVETDNYPKDYKVDYYSVKFDGSDCKYIESETIEYNYSYSYDETRDPDYGKEMTYSISKTNDGNSEIFGKYIVGDNKTWLYLEHDGEVTEIAHLECGYISADCVGDNIYYSYNNSNKNNHTIYEYDINSGETKEIVNNSYYNRMEVYDDEGFIIYQDRNTNLWRYDIDTDKSIEVYPNKGFNTYGKAADFRNYSRYGHIGESDYHVYKIDKEGNVVDIVTDAAQIWIYVKNGDKQGE